MDSMDERYRQCHAARAARDKGIPDHLFWLVLHRTES